MRYPNLQYYFYLIISLFLITGCEKEEDVSGYKMSIYSTSPGVINAVKKAYQMTDLQFTPVNNIDYNNGTYYANTTYQGLIYSSVKEIDTYVGSDVSFHTFMTAINNPRSKIYTERLNQSPYHGTNCRAYYGTVCSALVSYALGLPVIYATYDFPTSKLMRKLSSSHPDSIQVGDVLYKEDHVALITGLSKDEAGHVKALEISEAVQDGCRRSSILSSNFETLMRTKYISIHRYLDIDKNTEYQSVAEFVPVLDEQTVPFIYNDDVCVDKGDKSCYLEGEEVIVNILHSVEKLEIYKDDLLYKEIDIRDNLDISLKDIPYGDYKARVSWGGINSDYTCWKVVNVTTKIDRSAGKVFFSSKNAIPHKIKVCSKNGGRSNKIYTHRFTDKEISQGYANIPSNGISESCPYLHVSFKTEYGNIIDKPKNWY